MRRKVLSSLHAHQSLGLGQTFFVDSIFIDIARRHNAEAAQVVISRAVLQGRSLSPYPESSNKERIIKKITVSDPCCIEPVMSTFLKLLKLSDDAMTSSPGTTGSPECARKLPKHDALQGAV